jgi:hypothetical protein
MRTNGLGRAGRSLALAIGLGGMSTAAAWGATISSDFSAGTDGWTQAGATVFQQQASGGNPGGFLYIDNSEGAVTYLVAPAKFLGDLRGFDGGVLSFDGIQLGNGGSPWQSFEDYGHITFSGPGGSATLDLLPAPGQPGTTWTTYQATFSAANFGVSQSQWSAILANVTSVQLSVESLFGAEIEGIDNIALVPEPSVGGLLGISSIALLTRKRRT